MKAHGPAQSHGKDDNGEVTSPVKPKKPRARKPRTNTQNTTSKAAAPVNNEGARKGGPKRKVYVPKITTTFVTPNALILASGKDVAPLALVGAEEDTVSESDSNKKHKTDAIATSSGSADQAVSMVHSRRA